MKRLYKELKRKYYILTGVFALVFVLSIIFIGSYLVKTSNTDLYDAMTFIEFELENEEASSLKEMDLEEVVHEFRQENPGLKNLNINLTYDSNKYLEPLDKDDTDDINSALMSYKNGKIKNVDFGEFFILRKSINISDNKNFEIFLVKDMRYEKNFFFNLVGIMLLGLIVFIIISYIIVKSLSRDIKRELIQLNSLNENIDLENLNIQRPESHFKEFDKVITSYENMLVRLDSQNRKQIDFVHNASHELKTPIFIIKSYINLIKKRGTNENILKEATNLIDEEIIEMTSLIEKLLFIAKDSNLKLNKEDIEISDIVLGVISKLTLEYPKSQINFEPRFMIIHSDETLIKLLLKNLIENAIKYGESKPIDINIYETYIEIKDRGRGMSEEEVSHIFDKFYRVDSSHNKSIKGHGLGMTIVDKITKVLDIHLEISSTLDEGTTIHLYF